MNRHAKQTLPWCVVAQSSHAKDLVVSRHRWEWQAELAAHRRAWRDRATTGVFYTAYPAETGAEGGS